MKISTVATDSIEINNHNLIVDIVGESEYTYSYNILCSCGEWDLATTHYKESTHLIRYYKHVPPDTCSSTVRGFLQHLADIGLTTEYANHPNNPTHRSVYKTDIKLKVNN